MAELARNQINSTITDPKMSHGFVGSLKTGRYKVTSIGNTYESKRLQGTGVMQIGLDDVSHSLYLADPKIRRTDVEKLKSADPEWIEITASAIVMVW